VAVALTFHVIGRFSRGQVRTRWVDSTRPRIAEVEAGIERAWQEASRRPGVRLFDEPMCRLESFHPAADQLTLLLSRTSYKTFVGTNYADPQLADRYGPQVLANPLGISSLVGSGDGWVLLGRRSAAVAQYPLRIHTFGGALQVEEAADVFATAGRELAEELNLRDDDVRQIVCIGLVEDQSLRHPELIFHASSGLGRAQIEQKLDQAEHSAAVAIQAQADEVRSAAADPALTPVAAAALLLWGRHQFGADWFDAARQAVKFGGHEPA